MITNEKTTSGDNKLVRGLGLGSATTLNMIDMIGVGPFITIPLIVTAMGGPQAMLGWIFGALLSICDGLVWAELGASMPGSGGSYRYLKDIYGPQKLGRMMSFLFIWQLSFSAPLSIASGCVGLARYAAYIWPSLDHEYFARKFLVGPLEINVLANGGTIVAISVCLLALFLLYRQITAIGKLSKLLAVGVLGTIAWVIFAGLTNFDKAKAFSFPPDAFVLDERFFLGLGAAMLVAVYDYWGYYNVCFFGDEVKDPARNIPRAVIYSILAVASIYLVMNISILGVIPWQELVSAAKTDSRFYVASTLMQRVYGDFAGKVVSVLIMWTAFASVFSLLLGYSRVPYAASKDGNYFKVFSKIHQRFRFPHVSLLALGGVAILFCFLRLADLIAALVVIRIMVQFLFQCVGLIVLRQRRPEMDRPFRMWLYPVPALIAAGGFVYILFQRANAAKEIKYGIVIIIVGLAIYLVRSFKRREWPFLKESVEHGR
ncbi:MAG TPA: APC family permease [Terriglobales bacterium]|nr:APC family permease [Terriglobales bacterium]